MQIRFLAAAAAPLAVGTSLALTACGGSTPSRAATSSPQDAQLKFSRCMREHGIKFPDPTGAGPVSVHITNQQAFDAANTACAKYLTASEKKLTPAQRAEFQDKALQFARCMRAHGINVPDPQTTGNGGAISIQGRAAGPPGSPNNPGGGPDPNSPTFQATQKACQSLMPKLGGAGSMHFQDAAPGGKGPGGRGGGAAFSTGG